MHVVTILRYYLGLTQTELAAKAGITYADLNEIENKPGYGFIGKYRKLAECLHVPVHTIAMNDILSVPVTFFDEMQPGEYRSVTKSKKGVQGREGEEAVFQQERERLRTVNPILAKLLIPCYKLRAVRGYDILSYKEDGTPFFIEVKTSEKDAVGYVQLTKQEHDTAEKVTKQGYEYWLYHYSGWGLEKNNMKKILFSDMVAEDRISPARYWCDVKERKETENGILHFRKQLGITQIEAANLLEIPASTLCKYETGENQCPVTAYQKMSKLYGVKIDELLQEYPARNCG